MSCLYLISVGQCLHWTKSPGLDTQRYKNSRWQAPPDCERYSWHHHIGHLSRDSEYCHEQVSSLHQLPSCGCGIYIRQHLQDNIRSSHICIRNAPFWCGRSVWSWWSPGTTEKRNHHLFTSSSLVTSNLTDIISFFANSQMIVEEMNILTTVFLRYDNQKILFPNVTLATRPISNYYRSPDMGDSVDFSVHIATPTEKIASMKQRIIR